ncbi:MAG: hypothetical protein IPG29_10785 [Sphingobacteriales bacterium]|nr:hypothetical protein [Sphingobacteriales bacterium]
MPLNYRNKLNITQLFERKIKLFEGFRQSDGLRLGERQKGFKNRQPKLSQMLIEIQMFNYFHQPCFCQTDMPVAQLKVVKINIQKNLVKYF